MRISNIIMTSAAALALSAGTAFAACPPSPLALSEPVVERALAASTASDGSVSKLAFVAAVRGPGGVTLAQANRIDGCTRNQGDDARYEQLLAAGLPLPDRATPDAYRAYFATNGIEFPQTQPAAQSTMLAQAPAPAAPQPVQYVQVELAADGSILDPNAAASAFSPERAGIVATIPFGEPIDLLEPSAAPAAVRRAEAPALAPVVPVAPAPRVETVREVPVTDPDVARRLSALEERPAAPAERIVVEQQFVLPDSVAGRLAALENRREAPTAAEIAAQVRLPAVPTAQEVAAAMPAVPTAADVAAAMPAPATAAQIAAKITINEDAIAAKAAARLRASDDLRPASLPAMLGSTTIGGLTFSNGWFAGLLLPLLAILALLRWVRENKRKLADAKRDNRIDAVEAHVRMAGLSRQDEFGETVWICDDVATVAESLTELGEQTELAHTRLNNVERDVRDLRALVDFSIDTCAGGMLECPALAQSDPLDRLTVGEALTFVAPDETGAERAFALTKYEDDFGVYLDLDGVHGDFARIDRDKHGHFPVKALLLRLAKLRKQDGCMPGIPAEALAA